MFDINCGGIVVIHNFVKLINQLNNPNIYAKLFIFNNTKYKNIFCNDFENIYDVNDNTIVIYPEIVSGNPLNAKNIIRWILLDLGIDMPLNHYENWGNKDAFIKYIKKNNLHKGTERTLNGLKLDKLKDIILKEDTGNEKVFSFKKILGKGGKVGTPYIFSFQNKDLIIKVSPGINMFSRNHTDIERYKCFKYYSAI